MPGQDRSTAALANLALSKVNLCALFHTSSNQKLLVAIDPLYAIQWEAPVLAIGGGEKNNILLRLLRNSKLRRSNYANIAIRLTKSIILPDLVAPRDWGVGADIINGCNLYESAPSGRMGRPPNRFTTVSDLESVGPNFSPPR